MKMVTKELDEALSRISGLLEVEICALDLAVIAELGGNLPRKGDSKIIQNKVKRIHWKLQEIINKFKEIEGDYE